MRYKMKKLITLIISLILFSASKIEAGKYHHNYRISFEVFYYYLAPYGEWIEIDYGIYAWRPIRIRYGWSPYLYGRWVWTKYGWYWDSFEPFGWAVYHYGRWYFDDYYGWLWIPDYTWGPAWVEWRYTDRFIGWAPLPPYAGFSISIGIHFSINWYSHVDYWQFVPITYFHGNEVYRYVVPPKFKYRIYQESRHSIKYRYENDRLINEGVDKKFVEKFAGRVREFSVEDKNKLNDFSTERAIDRVRIYKPLGDEVKKTRELNIKRVERRINLDTEKILTPRERIEKRKPDPNQIDFDRRNRIDRIERRNFEEHEKDVFIPIKPNDVRTKERSGTSKRENDNSSRIFKEFNSDLNDRSPRTHERNRGTIQSRNFDDSKREKTEYKPEHKNEIDILNDTKFENGRYIRKIYRENNYPIESVQKRPVR